MTLKQLEPSDVLGENYYVYNITSSDYNPSLNGSITITCTLKNVYGTAVASKSLTLYQNGTSKGAQTTNSSGVATWSITCSSSGLQIFRIGAAAIEVYVDNKSELGHTHTKSQITDFPTIPDVSGKIDTAGTGLSKSGTTLNHSNSITALTTAAFKKFKYDAQGHITGTSDVSASDLPTHTHSQYLTEHQDLSDYVTTDDSRLSDARTPTSHTHTKSQITDFPNLGAVALSNDYDDLDNKPTIPTATSELSNDSGFLTSHQDISGKEDKSNKVSSWSSTTTDTHYPSEKLVKDSLDLKADTTHTHTIDLNSFDFYNADNWRTFDGNAPTISSDSIQANAVSHHILNKEFLESKYYTLTFEFNTASSRSGLYLFGDKDCNRMFEITTDIGNTFILQYDSNGNTTELYAGTKNHFTSGWHDIKVIRKGDTAIVYIDDELYYSFNNIGNCTNIFGLFKWSLYSVTIKNIDVSLDVTELPIDDYVDRDELKPKLAKSDTKTLDSQYMAYGTYNSWEIAEVFGGQEMANEISIEDDRIVYQYFQGRLKFTNNTPKRLLLNLTLDSGNGADNYYSFDMDNYTDLSSTATTITLESDEFVYLYCDSGNSTVLYSVRSDKNSIGTIVDMIYPVGSIYMNVNPTDPQILFGGTWTRLKDRFLLGSGDTYTNGSTGGSSTVALTKAQMPRHTHTQNSHSHKPTTSDNIQVIGVANDDWTYTSARKMSYTSGSYYYPYSSTNNGGVGQYTDTGTTTATNKYTGGTNTTEAEQNGSAHENMPPYLTVYMWKRTA